MREFYSRFLDPVRSCKVPVIGCINGKAVGAAACLASNLDLRLGTENSSLSWTFCKLGLSPGMWSHNLINLVGYGKASELLLTGDSMNGQDAYDNGFLNKLIKNEDDLLNESLKMADKIAHNAPAAVRATVKMLRSKQDINREYELQIEALNQATTYSTEDIKIGIQATIDKTKPIFINYEY